MAIQLDWPTVRARLRALLSFWQATSDERRDERSDESELAFLSPTRIARLQQELAALPEPCSRLQTLSAEASTALHAWHVDADAPNYLAIVTEPIEPQAKILRELLAAPPFGGMTRVARLQRGQLTNDSVTTWRALQETFGLCGNAGGSDRQIAVIPDLGWCFLRCVEGLDAIEALLAAVSADRSRFWLLGCNRWTWLYLDRVCYLSTYLSSSVSLPTLGAADLRRWLDPVAAICGLESPADDEDADDDETIWSSARERRCFAQIAELALGLPAVAESLWLQSLRRKGTGDDAPEELTYETPRLPALPDLTADDRYLLYNLGLHGGLTLPALTQSLAESEAIVRAQLQHLQHQGLIAKRDGRFEIAPLHYPRLKRDLDYNHLLVGKTN